MPPVRPSDEILRARVDAVFERQVSAELYTELVDAEIYQPEAPITRYVSSRLDVLCADEYEKPAVFVRRAKDKNAYALPGAVILDDGILDFIESQDELDAILAHELTHIHREHSRTEQQVGRNIIGSLGLTRAAETEADVSGMRLLDRRGINPVGMISLSDRFAVDQKDERFASPTHGSSLNRKINLEQSLWLLDARHLSDTHQPLQITPEEYGDVLPDAIDDTFSALPVVLKQRALIRLAGSQSVVDPELLNLQKELLYSEMVTDQELELQARLILGNANPVYTAEHPEVTVDSINILRSNLDLLQRENVTRVAGTAFESNQKKKFERILRNTVWALGEKQVLTEEDQEILQTIASHITETHSENTLLHIAKEAIHSKEATRQTMATIGKIFASTRIPRDSIIFQIGIEQPIKQIDSRVIQNATTIYKTVGSERLNTAEFLEGDLVGSLLYAANYSTAELDVRQDEVDLDDEEDNRSTPSFEMLEFQKWSSDEIFQAGIVDLVDVRRDSVEPLDDTEQFVDDDLLDAQHDMLQAIEKNEFALGIESMLLLVEPNDLALLLAKASGSESAVATSDIASAAELAAQLYRMLGREESELLNFYILSGNQRKLTRALEEYVNSVVQAALGLNKQDVKNPDFDEEVQDGTYRRQNPAAFKSLITKGHKELLKNLRNIDRLSRRFRSINPELGVDISTDVVEKSELVKDFLLLNGLARLSGKKPDSLDLITYMQTLNPSRIRDGGLFLTPNLKLEAQEMWQESVDIVASQPELLATENHLLAIAALGLVSSDLEVNLHVPGRAFARIAELRDFEGGLSLVGEEYFHLPGTMLRAALDVVIERKATTPEQFARINEYADSMFVRLVADKQEIIGGASVVETHVLEAYRTIRERERQVGIKNDTIRGLESTKLMRALLMTGHDDSELKSYIAKRWWLGYRTHPRSDVQDKFKVEDIAFLRQHGKEHRLRHWLYNENPKPGQYKPLGDTLDNLYLSTGAARYFAVRNLLLGNQGVLADQQGRDSLVGGLMESWIDLEPESTGSRVMESMLRNILSRNPPEKVYQYISPVLQDMILHPPAVASSSETIAQSLAKEVLDAMVLRGSIKDPQDRDMKALTIKISELMQIHDQPDDGAKLSRNKLLGLFDDIESVQAFEQLSPTELALLVGKRSGALGTRMLQLAGQYFSIPEAERERFAEVYDSMIGQTRLQAFNVIDREAGYALETAELLHEVASFDGRLGGGSLVTVYGVTLKDGSKEVLGIRNPNAEFHVHRLAKLLQNGLEVTAKEFTDEQDLQLADSLLVDAVKWIRDELNDTQFEAKDAVFRAENNTRGEAPTFSKGRARYDIKIPYTKPTGSLWIRREEFVPGKNLNNLTIRDDMPTDINAGVISRTDAKDAISLLTRNYVHQLLRGSFVHSDIHPGNFRITPDNSELVVFDRYNLIPVSDELRSTIRRTITSLATGNRAQAIDSILDFSVDPVKTPISGDLRAELDTLLADQQDPSQAIAQITIVLKRHGVRVPIQLSLILRNIFSLTNLSHKVGFSNVFEAFMHTAEPSELSLFA